MKKVYFLLGLILIISCFSGIGQTSADLLGMGNAPGPAQPGDNGIEWNPAAMSPGNVFVLDLALLNTSIKSDSFDLMDVLEYGGLVEGSDSILTEEEVNAILDSIPDDGMSLYLNHTTRPKIIIGPVGLSVGVQGYGRGTLDKDIFTLLLKGNGQYIDLDGDISNPDPDKLISLSDTQTDVLVTGDVGATVSIPLQKISVIGEYFDEFYVGGSYHVVAGGYGNIGLTDDTDFYLAYGEADEDGIRTVNIFFADQTAVTEKFDEMEDGETLPILRGVYTLDPDNPTDTDFLGMGSAIDLGIYGRRGKLAFGLSSMNNGSLKFNNYQILEYGIVKDSTVSEQFTLPDEPIIRDGENPIKVPLPSRINAGVSYQFYRWLLVGLQASTVKNVSVNLDNNDQMIFTTKRNYELGAGVELNPIRILPLRAGIILTKNSLSYTTGLGLHLGPFKTDLGAAFNLKSASVGLNTSLEF